MLRIKSGKPEAIAIPLGGGANWRVRPATSFEVTLAQIRAGELTGRMAESQDAVERLEQALGDEFDVPNFAEKAWTAAAADRLVLLELLTICSEGWSGVELEGDSVTELPHDKTSIAMVLREPKFASLAAAAVYSPIHVEVADEKKSQASPIGGAATDGNTVQIADEAGSAAPPA
jgi:hypothetical protein